MRSMVEGHARIGETGRGRAIGLCPSTTLRVVPLPPWGRI